MNEKFLTKEGISSHEDWNLDPVLLEAVTFLTGSSQRIFSVLGKGRARSAMC